MLDLKAERANFAAEQKQTQETVASLKMVFEKTLRLGDLLCLSKPHPLGLEDLTARIICFDGQAARLYCLGVKDRVFYGLNLLDLITSSRPDKKKGERREIQDRGDFFGDTSEYLNPARRDREDDLMSRHLHHLDPWWSEYTTHHLGRYDLAVRTLDPEEAREGLTSRYQRLIELDYAAANLPLLVKAAARYNSYYYWDVYRFLKNNTKLLEGLNLNLKDFQGGAWRNKLKTLMHNFPEDLATRKQWVKAGLLEITATFLFAIDTTQKPYDVVSTTYPVSTYKTEYLCSNRVRINLNGSWVEGNVSQDSFTPDRWFLLDPSTQGLSPLLLWLHKKDTRKDTYLAAEVPNIVKDDFPPCSNTNLGLVLAASLSGDVRNKLPRRLSYYDISGEQPPEGKRPYKQYIMEAQQPLMLSIFRSQVVKAPIFTGVKELVGSRLD